MPDLPFDMFFDEAIFAMLIPLLVAGAFFFVSSRLVPRCGDLVGGALALVVGILVGNYFLGAIIKFTFGPDDTFSVVEFFQGLSRSVLPPVEGQPRGMTPRYWLPWSVFIASLVGLVARLPRLPLALAWLLRTAAAVLAARLLVEDSLRTEHPWLWPAFAVAVLALWALLESLAKESRGGWTSFAIGFVFMAAGAVLIHAHSALLTEIASLFAAVFFGVAIAAWLRKADASAVAPVAAVALPGLMLLGQQLTFSEVPLSCFMLIALAPLALVPLLLLQVKAASGKALVLVGVVLLLVPVVIALVLTMLAESIAIG